MTAARRALVRRAHEDQAGVSLVELLMAGVILAIVMSALAATLISMLQQTSRNEQDVRATALAQQAVEEMRVAEWDSAVLYEDETAADAGDPARIRWRSRVAVDGDGDLALDGEKLVLVPGPPATRTPASVTPADIPYPTQTISTGGIDYHIDRYVVFTTRVKPNDTRLFVTYVSWVDRFETLRQVRFEAERVPTPEEAAATDDGLRILYFVVNPDPVDLKPSNGKPEAPINVVVRTNKPLALGSPTLTHEYLEVVTPPTGPIILAKATRTITACSAGVPSTPCLAHSDMATTIDPVNGNTTTGFLTWKVTLGTSRAFWNGFADFTFKGENACLNCEDIERSKLVEFRYGPYAEPGAPSPSPSPSPSGTATPTPTPTPSPTGPVTITGVTPITFCTQSSDERTAAAVTFNVTVSGLNATNPAADGTLTVIYDRLAAKNGGPDAGSGSGSHVSGNTWRFVLPSGAGFWSKDRSYDFRFKIARASDGSTHQYTQSVSVTKCPQP